MGASDPLGKERVLPDHCGPNEQLRFAREQFPSRRTPGERMSRQELAELVNQWIYDHAGQQRAELDDKYIGKLERGAIRWPGQRYREALRAILRAETDAQLGFYMQRRRSARASVTDVDRQQFFRMAGTVMALPWLDLFGPTEPTPVPAKIGRIEVDQVRSATKVFCSWQNTYGGGLARETVVAQLRWSAQLLHSDCPENLRPELFAAVAELCTVAGFMAFDAGVHDDARRAFRFGLACAEQSGNWHVRNRLLNDMTVQAVECGRPDEALTHAELGLVRPENLTARELATLYANQARALAKVGRVQDTLAAIGAGDEALDSGAQSEDRSWEGPYDHVVHRSLTGSALFNLALSGRKTQAEDHLAYALAHQGGWARARVLTQTEYASLLMVTGDPREAAAVGHQVLNGAGSIRSRRVVDGLRELERFADRHKHIAEAVELRERIGEMEVRQSTPNSTVLATSWDIRSTKPCACTAYPPVPPRPRAAPPTVVPCARCPSDGPPRWRTGRGDGAADQPGRHRRCGMRGRPRLPAHGIERRQPVGAQMQRLRAVDLWQGRRDKPA
jgi:hypothetical protein